MIAFSGASKLVERSWLIYRRHWLVFFSGFAEPLVFLLVADVGLDPLVGEVAGPGGVTMTYPEFVGTGLLASAAMNGALFDVTYNLYYRIKYTRLFDTVATTPLSLGHALLGEVLWSQLRGTAYAIGFLAVLVGTGLVTSWWALLALPAAMLIGFAFAAIGAAATTFARSWADLDYVILVMLPLYLFSTGFYPIEVYPDWAQPIITISPLYHGVTLVRSLSVGIVDVGALVHVGYLLALGVVGLTVLRGRITRLTNR